MITLFILILLLVVGILLVKYTDYDFEGMIICIVISFFIIIHSVGLLVVKYNYEKFIAERDALEQVLYDTRKSETFKVVITITEVSRWNMELAKLKYDNTTLLFDQYIDDRIMEVEPIDISISF